MTTTRRQFLDRMAKAGSAAFLGGLAASRQGLAGDARLLGTVPFVGEGAGAPGRLTGQGLGGRLALDLSTLSPETLIVSNEDFFIRTRFPDRLQPAADTKIRVRGLVKEPRDLRLAKLRPAVRPLGPHLLECSGNSGYRRFGLLSAARWSGVPWGEVLAALAPRPRGRRVLISGFDEHSQPAGGSMPGASWIFTHDQLASSGAFLATAMNGVPLPRDHGHPVRLVVPGWYGCACIKWVDEIAFVDDGAPATRQMREFAGRTHQAGVPELARDYEPASIDLAAMPVRVEKWLTGGRLVYRITGILWGGERTTDRLLIQCHTDQPYVPVDDYQHRTHTTWTLWTHRWHPPRPGRYRIRLKVDDPRIRTRRLDGGYYARTVAVDEV